MTLLREVILEASIFVEEHPIISFWMFVAAGLIIVVAKP
jgi:hypothetical protein